ncbi:hypothetical protein GCM10009839_37290 [Catenulispora yoronensis]|uniref:Uncharacterized protein n=1 Tax=Catenulispora yoronensis TaxID=450799 RepID=A0ABN2UCS9_9ACTN
MELAPKLKVTFTPGCAASKSLPIWVKVPVSDAAASTVRVPLTAPALPDALVELLVELLAVVEALLAAVAALVVPPALSFAAAFDPVLPQPAAVTSTAAPASAAPKVRILITGSSPCRRPHAANAPPRRSST